MEDLETQKIIDNIITVLIRLDTEAHQPNIEISEYMKRGLAIKNMLEKVETDFGSKIMIDIFLMTNKRLGRTLNPLDPSILKKLLSHGFKINKIEKCASYKK
jgi:hypothetical protein